MTSTSFESPLGKTRQSGARRPLPMNRNLTSPPAPTKKMRCKLGLPPLKSVASFAAHRSTSESKSRAPKTHQPGLRIVQPAGEADGLEVGVSIEDRSSKFVEVEALVLALTTTLSLPSWSAMKV